MRLVGSAGLTAVLVLTLAACGSRTSGPSAEEEGAWRVQDLAGERAVDSPAVLASAGDDVLALLLSADGVLQSHLSTGGGELVAGEPLDTGLRYVALGGAVRLPDGDWFALGSGGVVGKGDAEDLAFDAVGFRSDDGLVWRRVAVRGFDGAVDVNDLTVHRGAVVVAGNHRGAADPSAGGFVAAVWASPDSEVFTEVALPAAGTGESVAGEVDVVGDDLLVAGRTGRGGALWSSDDGRTFELSRDPVVAGTHHLSALESVGSTVVASTGGGAGQLLRSEDAGRTWALVDAPSGGGEGFTPVWEAAGRLLTLGGGAGEAAWPRPEVCYADLARCGESPPLGLYAGRDGATWQRVDLAGAGASAGDLDQVVGTADGRTLVLAGTRVAVWPAGEGLPEGDEPAGPPTVEVRMLAEGEQPVEDVRYHAPLYVHCGMDWLWFGGEPWRRTDDGPDVSYEGEDGAEGWPISGQMIYGFATLTDTGVVEYTTGEGEVIATYERGGRGGMCD